MSSIKSKDRDIGFYLTTNIICSILRIPTVGERIYETKSWPQLEGFIPRQVVQCLCGLDNAETLNLHQG